VTLFAGQPPGGGIDTEMRLVARFLGKFIPGEPNILPMNMQGAGGIILGNHLYGVAKPDGLTLGMPGRTGFALAPVISAADTKYDLRKFTWIGSSASSNFVLWMRRQANIRSFDDLRNAKRTIIIASSGSTTANSIMPEVLARYEKLSLKVVRGYPGINDAILAVERGEADGVLCQKASLRSDMIASGAVVPVFQVMDLEPGVALLDGLVTDQKEKALLEMLSAPQRLGLPVIGPPGMPEDRYQLLRRSYLNMVASSDYQVEAMKRGLDIGQPNTGEELAQFVATKLAAFPAETIEEYRRYVEKRAMTRLEGLVEAVADRLAPVLCTRHGQPYVEILRMSAEERADLIVIGVHGRNVVGMTLFGSTTNHVVRQATCPVFTLRQ
jgi:tripartite-type tricarboxylate transporter receptor subunit TctC